MGDTFPLREALGSRIVRAAAAEQAARSMGDVMLAANQLAGLSSG